MMKYAVVSNRTVAFQAGGITFQSRAQARDDIDLNWTGREEEIQGSHTLEPPRL